MAFDYSSRDYETIRADLLARAARVFPEWTDRDPSDFGMLLVDLWSYMGDIMHYYIDRAAGEAFLSTATQRESVLALANLLDYVPRGRASGSAVITLDNSTLSDITIAPLTEFIARSDNTTYSCYTEVGGTIAASSTGTISVREGTLYVAEVLTSSANGSPGQIYTLANDRVDVGSLSVTVYEDGVNPVAYRRVNRIIDAASGERVYVATVSADGFLNVSFGSLLNGFIPTTGARITATYASSSGAAGNLPADSITGFKASAPTGLTLSSATAFSGGLDEESITSLRTSIPSVISAQNRAVTRSDFVALATQVPDVSKATISFSPSLTGASAGNASVTVYPQGAVSDYLTTVDTSYAVPSTMQTDVVEFIQPLALLGVTVLCASTVTWEPIKASVTVHVSDRYVSNWVKNDVEAAIDELFAFDNVFFGQRLTLGQLYRIVLNVPGVDYCTVSVFDLESGSGLQDSILVNELRLPKKGTITLTMTGGITTT
jgi:predicted phage baseplate assembly protein